jgi:hypothetical protein
VNAIAPMRSAWGPTCTRTVEKSEPSAVSILLRTASGKGRPPAEASPSCPASTANAPPPLCRCTAPCRPVKAGSGGPGGRAGKAALGGLAWIGGSLAGIVVGNFGWPLKNDPWITFPLMPHALRTATSPMPGGFWTRILAFDVINNQIVRTGCTTAASRWWPSSR